jgi:DNA-binding NarL/FixJ family response regulator
MSISALPRHEFALTRAVLVDDHRLLAQTMALALGLEGIDCSVAELDDRASLVGGIIDGPPALVLLDLDLGEVIGDGADLVAPLVEAGCRVLVVSGSSDVEQVARALAAGAAGVVRKDAPFDVLLDTALEVARGGQVLAPEARRSLLDEARRLRAGRAEQLAPFERLSAREADVLRALATGQAVAAIAETWFVSEATVRSHVRAILTKLGVTSQLEAVAAAHRHQWLRAPVADVPV